jgi:hypothetical protein
MILPDQFLDHDTPPAMYAKAGLDAAGIVAKVFSVFGTKYGAAELLPGEIAVLADRVQRRRKARQANGRLNGGAV